ncbi:MAG TPA: PQ-loop domain-containing transporter [Candidatus Gastranaerophilaceae bacterium]|nr:PQ-loop domain-containing transporter [Candidatus Gastranaerophilaceae bacterium]
MLHFAQTAIHYINSSNFSYYEILMLVCFGISWPVALLKSYQTKSVKGKSFLFLLLILLGYIFGTVHKIMYSFDYVIWLYIINGAMVLADMALWILYRNND